MRRAAVVLAAALAGCPIPQPLPDYPPGTITPPRILLDEVAGDGAVILVPANCTTVAPAYVLSARVVDSNTIESIESRWFVNYDFRDSAWSEIRRSDVIPPNADTTNLTRAVPPFTFEPYRYPPPYGTELRPGPPYRYDGIVRVVELVVSNGFDPAALNTIVPAANRAPLPGFETQFHRWVFLAVPPSASVPCP
jgi:hypothetical protein